MIESGLLLTPCPQMTDILYRFFSLVCCAQKIPTDSQNLHKVYIQEHYSKIVPEFVNLIVDPLAIFTSETLGHSKVLFLCPTMLLTCCKLTN